MDAATAARIGAAIKEIDSGTAELTTMLNNMLDEQQKLIGRAASCPLETVVVEMVEALRSAKEILLQQREQADSQSARRAVTELHDKYVIPMICKFVYESVQGAIQCAIADKTAVEDAVGAVMGRWSHVVSVMIRSVMNMRDRIGDTWRDSFLDKTIASFVEKMVLEGRLEDDGALTLPITTTVSITPSDTSEDGIKQAIMDALGK